MGRAPSGRSPRSSFRGREPVRGVCARPRHDPSENHLRPAGFGDRRSRRVDRGTSVPAEHLHGQGPRSHVDGPGRSGDREGGRRTGHTRMTRIHAAGSLAPLFALLLTPQVLSQPAQPLRGFSAANAERERSLEDQFRKSPKPENLREHMRAISSEPHAAGSSNSKKVAEYVLNQFKSYGLNASIEQFEALMPYPTERVVEMTAPERYVAKLKEPPVPEDPDSSDEGQLPTFNAYSADGDVTGELVYVNYGVPADYEQLAKLGVDVKGKIVIARYGQSWRGIKPKVAYEHGAIGCIIYSDPRDDGYWAGDTYPKGAYRPEQGVQRG